MSCLIDGYNLLHAMGALHARAGPHEFQKARLRLLGLLHGVYGSESSKVTVIFDAAGARPGSKEEQDYKGIRVRFAVHHPQADDLIEHLIRHDSAPKHLTVVSDDHRIQQAARRRQCTVKQCAEYLEELERLRPQRETEPAREKRDAPSAEETQHWLEEFAGLEDDPALRAFFELDDFSKDKMEHEP